MNIEGMPLWKGTLDIPQKIGDDTKKMKRGVSTRGVDGKSSRIF
jgi:hypothetical protein